MAKYCMKCGGQCADQAMQCPRCGAMLGMQNSGNVSQRPSGGGSQFSGGYASPKQMQSINGMRPQESNGNIYSSESRNNKKWIRNISIVLGTLVVVVCRRLLCKRKMARRYAHKLCYNPQKNCSFKAAPHNAGGRYI